VETEIGIVKWLTGVKDDSRIEKMIDVLNLLYCVGNRGLEERNECIERISDEFFAHRIFKG
jgi:hypothetical protein